MQYLVIENPVNAKGIVIPWYAMLAFLSLGELIVTEIKGSHKSVYGKYVGHFGCLDRFCTR